MTDGDKRYLDDAGLDRLLALASRPTPAPGFEERLAQRMAASSAAGSNVIAFRARKPASPVKAPARSLRWPFVAAMAASLVIGLWLGGSGQVESILDMASETAMLDTGAAFAPAGLDELGTVDAENLS